MIDKERLDFLQQYVSNDANVRELLEYYKETIFLHHHTPSIYTMNGIVLQDPNGIESVRSMAVLEFITTILNLNQGENDGRAEQSDDSTESSF